MGKHSSLFSWWCDGAGESQSISDYKLDWSIPLWRDTVWWCWHLNTQPFDFQLKAFTTEPPQLAQVAPIDSNTSTTELTPLKECIELMQASCVRCCGSVVKALSYRPEGCVFKSQHCLMAMVGSKDLQLCSCILHQPNDQMYWIICYFMLYRILQLFTVNCTVLNWQPMLPMHYCKIYNIIFFFTVYLCKKLIKWY